MEEAEKERIVREAVRRIVEARSSTKPSTGCLSAKTICSLCEGTLPDSRRESVLSHLQECRRCCDDVSLYFDLMESKRKSSAKARSGKSHGPVAAASPLSALKAFAEYLATPANAPLAQDKLNELSEEFTAVLSQRGFSPATKGQADALSLMTQGYDFSMPQGKARVTGSKAKKTSGRGSSRHEIILVQRLYSLLEILVSSTMPASAKAALADELLSLAEERLGEHKRKRVAKRKARKEPSKKSGKNE